MRFKTSVRSLLALTLVCAFTACGMETDFGAGNDYLVGEKTQAFSSMSDSTGQADRTEVVMFDKTVRLLHHFDLNRMVVKRTIPVSKRDESHSVIFDQASGLIVDMADGHVTLFDRDGASTVDPIRFTGKAISTAYRPAHGMLVIYDDMSNVGLLKLDSSGHVIKSWLGGPLLDGVSGNEATITSGDLNDSGNLILALSDGSIATVDMTATMSSPEGAWISTRVATTLDRIRWVAPLRGSNDKVLIVSGAQHASKVSLVSTVTGAVLEQKTVGLVAVSSKAKDPHVIAQRDRQTEITYANATSLLTRSVSIDAEDIVDSRLSLSEGTWSFLDASKTVSWKYNKFEKELSKRTLRKYRLIDMMATSKKELPDQAQLNISGAYVFALYPSELGRAERLGISDDSKVLMTKFNLGHIGRK